MTTNQTRQMTTLGQCLRQLTGQRIRPTEILYLFLGKQGWTLAEQVRERLTTSRTLDLYWDAYLIGDGREGQQEVPGIYLFAPGGQSFRAFEIEEAKLPHMQQEMTQQEALEQLESSAHLLYRLHQTYITHDWGTFRLTGETYREKGEKEWQEAQAAFADLKGQVAAHPPLLNRSSLETFTRCIQGMRIRLAQRFAENRDDPSIQEDARRADRAWADLNQADLWLYQQLG